MVREITSQADFNKTINSPNLVVVDFFGTWCGPCMKIAPIVEQYSRKYPEVTFVKVNDQVTPDVVMSNGISAFPTFHFYINGRKVDEMRGANPQELENKVIQWKTNAGTPFSGTGNTLGGWDGIGQPPGPGGAGAQAAREARLKVLGQKAPASSNNSSPAPSVSSQYAKAVLASEGVDDDDDAAALKEALKLSMAQKAANDQDEKDTAEAFAQFEEEQRIADEGMDIDGDDMVAVPVNDELLAQLLDMGFSDTRARKGLVHGKDNLDAALVWLGDHEGDPDIDQPYMVRKADADKEAAKKNRVPLTPEEREARVAQLKSKIESNRKERERAEKAANIQREKERREQGQKMETMQEERDRQMRKREAERLKKEKEDEKKERERLRQEIARDKELRRINKGVLPSVLGVDGYNPSVGATVSDPVAGGDSKVVPSSATSSSGALPLPPSSGMAAAPSSRPSAKASSISATSAATSEAPETKESALLKVEAGLNTLSRYRTGGDGGQAIKMLMLFIQNIVQNPTEEKYRTINMESKAFKSKVAPFVGPLQLLKAVGFVKNEEEQKLVLQNADMAILQEALSRIQIADRQYIEKNGS